MFRKDENAVIIINDTGAGISAELLPLLFKPFVQENRTLDRSRGGLGLGLSFSKGIIELHEGTISVQSDGVGHGTTFKITLPIKTL